MPSSSAAFGLLPLWRSEGLVDRLHLEVAEVQRGRRPSGTAIAAAGARRTGAAGAPAGSAARRRGSWRARSRWPARGRCPASVCAMSAASASGVKSSSSLPARAPNRAARCRARSGMSSTRSRSGGSGISNVLMRNQRSSRNSPAATISSRSRLRGADHAHVAGERLVVAHAADLAAFEEPQQLGLHRPWAARRSRRGTACRRWPPRTGPVRCSSAPVKAPLRWPNSSLSIRFSGSAPQLIGTKRHLGPEALVVHGPGDQFLAGAGLAEDQHGGVGRARPWRSAGGPARIVARLADQVGRAFDAVPAAA